MDKCQPYTSNTRKDSPTVVMQMPCIPDTYKEIMTSYKVLVEYARCIYKLQFSLERVSRRDYRVIEKKEQKKKERKRERKRERKE
jgi:hypothetical protein